MLSAMVHIWFSMETDLRCCLLTVRKTVYGVPVLVTEEKISISTGVSFIRDTMRRFIALCRNITETR